ncbi:MAG: hypothetical protein ABH811_02845 [archaeon]
MQLNEKRVPEIFLGLILILLLLIVVLLVLNLPFYKEKESEKNTYTNSYNTYYITQQSTKEYHRYDNLETDKDYLDYSSSIREITSQGIFGNDIDKYIVSVKNNNPKGGYFTVKFHFKDYYNKETTESVTNYLRPYEKREFYYRDIHADRYKHYDWNYEVISHTKE